MKSAPLGRATEISVLPVCLVLGQNTSVIALGLKLWDKGLLLPDGPAPLQMEYFMVMGVPDLLGLILS